MTVDPLWRWRRALLVFWCLCSWFLWFGSSRRWRSFGGWLFLRRLKLLRSGHRWIELGGDDGRQSRLRLGWLDDNRRGRRSLAAGRRQGRSAEDNVLLFGRWVVGHGWFGPLCHLWEGRDHRAWTRSRRVVSSGGSRGWCYMWTAYGGLWSGRSNRRWGNSLVTELLGRRLQNEIQYIHTYAMHIT